MISNPASDAGNRLDESGRRSSILALCAGLGIAASLVHAEAAIDHLNDYAPYAPMFILLAAVQMIWAIGLLRNPSRRWLRFGLLLGISVIVIWGTSRTYGIPIAPKPWVRQTIGPADAGVTLDEIATVLAIGFLLTRGQAAERWPSLSRHVAPVLGVILCVTLLLAVGGGHAS